MVQVIGVEEAQTAMVFVPVDALAALKAIHNAAASAQLEQEFCSAADSVAYKYTKTTQRMPKDVRDYEHGLGRFVATTTKYYTERAYT